MAIHSGTVDALAQQITGGGNWTFYSRVKEILEEAQKGLEIAD